MQSKGREHAGGGARILGRGVARIVANKNRCARVSLGPEKAERIGNAPDASLIEAVV